MCDICGVPIPDSAVQQLASEIVVEAASRGFVPKRYPGSDLESWRETVALGSAVDWGLCQACLGEFAPYGTEEPALEMPLDPPTDGEPPDPKVVGMLMLFQSRPLNPQTVALQILQMQRGKGHAVADHPAIKVSIAGAAIADPSFAHAKIRALFPSLAGVDLERHAQPLSFRLADGTAGRCYVLFDHPMQASFASPLTSPPTADP